MGGLPVALLVLFVLAVVVVLIVVLAGLGKSAATGKEDPREGAEEAPHVRYRIPEGQDPTVVVTALRDAGYEAVPDQGTYEQVVIVPLSKDTPESRDRVREAVAAARATNVDGPAVLDPAPVRFVDEEPII